MTPIESDYNPAEALCSACGLGLTETEYRWSNSRQGEPLIHPRCAAFAIQREGTVTISLREYDILNAARLLIEPLMDCSPSTNRYHAECQLGATRWLAEMNQDSLFLVLARFEAISAGLSLILAKNYKNIKAALDEREKAKFAKVAVIREEPTKRERVALSDRDKALRALMNNGVSESAAKQIVDAEFIKQGRIKLKV